MYSLFLFIAVFYVIITYLYYILLFYSLNSWWIFLLITIRHWKISLKSQVWFFFFYLKTLFRTRNLPKQMSDEELSQLSPNIYYYYYYYYYLQQSNYNFLFRREKICENYRKHNHEEIIWSMLSFPFYPPSYLAFFKAEM